MTDHKTTYNNSLQNYADVETTNQQTKALDKALTRVPSTTFYS